MHLLDNILLNKNNSIKVKCLNRVTFECHHTMLVDSRVVKTYRRHDNENLNSLTLYVDG